MIKPPKSKKQPICKWCKNAFTRSSSLQKVCTWTCGLKLAESERVKKEQKAFKAETAVMKKAIKDKDRAYWIKKSQTAFNAYIRARDAGLPCISCGVPDGQGKRNACHYRPAGVNTALRFNEDNVFGGCERCNTYQSGNLVNYRIGLIKRIGIEKVEWLESNHEIKKWSVSELKAIEAQYKAKLKALR